MKCEICGNDKVLTICVIPLPKPTGELNTMACQPCAVEKGMFCEKHQKVHLGFVDGTHVCLGCHKELFEAELGRAKELTCQMMMGLVGQAGLACEDYMKGLLAHRDRCFKGQNLEIACLHLLTQKALRAGKTVDEVVMDIIAAGRANSLFV